MPPIERARPLLGTYVAIRAAGTGARAAHHAIETAFAEIALIHALMSFHERDSDVARLNRDAARRPVRVHPHTAAVLHWSCALAAASDGCFDITVAPRLVATGSLPKPDDAARPDPRGSWRDIELGADDAVRFHRPLWIDLGGVAKGYAVDCAIAQLVALGVTQCCVNAGGDLRVAGADVEHIALRSAVRSVRETPIVALHEGALASSETGGGVHVDARRGALEAGRFACVVADRCVLADGLTKVVLARGRRAAALLCRYGATAHLCDASGWRSFGAAA